MAISREEIWELSEGNCYICGLKMLRGSECEMLNFTIEHWTPKSRIHGKGKKAKANADENKKAAHWLCNNKKDSRKGVELDEKFIRSCQFEIKQLLRGWT